MPNVYTGNSLVPARHSDMLSWVSSWQTRYLLSLSCRCHCVSPSLWSAHAEVDGNSLSSIILHAFTKIQIPDLITCVWNLDLNAHAQDLNVIPAGRLLYYAILHTFTEIQIPDFITCVWNLDLIAHAQEHDKQTGIYIYYLRV